MTSELPDPRLKGTFHEEEMQVMAYLAKECLLLDPDCRPTMSEVVQILSTITPEKSKRTNMSVQVFQVSIFDFILVHDASHTAMNFMTLLHVLHL